MNCRVEKMTADELRQIILNDVFSSGGASSMAILASERLAQLEKVSDLHTPKFSLK